MAEQEELERRPKVVAEIAAALTRDPASWVASAKAAESRGGFASETIVHLVRHVRAKPQQRRVMGELILALDQRVTRLVARWARGFDETGAEEIALEIGRAIIELVLGEGPPRTCEFLECSFDTAVKRRILNAVEKRDNRPKLHEVAWARRRAAWSEAYETAREEADQTGREPDVPRPPPEPGDSGATDVAMGVSPEAALATAEEGSRRPELLRAGLAAIKDPRHREALILHHFEGWPIESEDPDVETLCTRYDLEGRQVRRWIATAIAQAQRAMETHDDEP
jgi:hypothetical protein